MYADKTLTCTDCGAFFTFGAGEQEFHAQKGFSNEPKRCPGCRSDRQAEHGGSSTMRYGSRDEMFTATCAQCGNAAQIPFQPRGDGPVYCSNCFRTRRERRSNRDYAGAGERLVTYRRLTDVAQPV